MLGGTQGCHGEVGLGVELRNGWKHHFKAFEMELMVHSLGTEGDRNLGKRNPRFPTHSVPSLPSPHKGRADAGPRHSHGIPGCSRGHPLATDAQTVFPGGWCLTCRRSGSRALCIWPSTGPGTGVGEPHCWVYVGHRCSLRKLCWDRVAPEGQEKSPPRAGSDSELRAGSPAHSF